MRYFLILMTGLLSGVNAFDTDLFLRSNLVIDSTLEVIVTDSDWNSEATAQTRCSFVNQDTLVNVDTVAMTADTLQRCLNPFTLQGAVLKVPNNTTRIDKDGLALCEIEQEEKVPTIIVYVLDHSGSMDNNDPNGIADDAFKNAIQSQADNDSTSYAAYIPFNGDFIESDTIEPLQLSSSDNILKIQNSINDTYGGTTDFYDPLILAEEFLSRSEYDGYNKAIIMLADGDDQENLSLTDSLAASTGFPRVYGIFLGANATGEQRMESIANATGAYSTQIDDANDVAPLITQLVNDLVVTATPTKLKLTNQSNGAFRIAFFDRFTQQVDGSWVLSFGDDIPLEESSNEMLLNTIYRIGGEDVVSTPVTFTIEVTDEVVNEGVDIESTPFGTKCVEFNSINVFEEDSLLIDTLVNRVDSILIELTAFVEDELGDSVDVIINSRKTGDRFNTNLKLFSNNDTIVTYRGYVPVDFSDVNEKSDSTLLINPFDSILIKRLNNIDSRDFQITSFDVKVQPQVYFSQDTSSAEDIGLNLIFPSELQDSISVEISFLDTTLSPYFLGIHRRAQYLYIRSVQLSSAFLLREIPEGEFELIAKFTDPSTGLSYFDTTLVIRPQFPLDSDPLEVVLFDKNIDGRLDSIRIPFTDTINTAIKESYQYTITWPNLQDSIVEYTIDSEFLSGYSREAINDQIEFNLTSLDFSRSQTGLDSSWGDVVVTQLFTDDFGTFTREWDDLPVIDSMAPILVSSEVFWVEDGYDSDQLVIRFSEPLDTNISQNDELFNFLVGDQLVQLNYGDDFEWRKNGQEFVIFFGGDDKTHNVIFNPRDGVQAIVGDGYLIDKNGLSISNFDEFVNVDGGFNERIEVTNLSVFNLTDEFASKEDIELEVFDLSQDAISIIESKNEQGMVLGPLKVNETDPRAPEDIRWRYQFLVYSHLGQFVTRKHGVIECTSDAFKTETSSNCKDSRGIKIALKWNYKDDTGRFVGTGVYILGLQVEDRVLVTNKVAVRRTSDVLEIEF